MGCTIGTFIIFVAPKRETNVSKFKATNSTDVRRRLVVLVWWGKVCGGGGYGGGASGGRWQWQQPSWPLHVIQ